MIKIIKPSREKTMMKFMDDGSIKIETFCQLLRSIYNNKSSNNEIRIKSRFAVGYAKSITKRLKRYKSISGGDIKIMGMRTHKPISVAKIKRTRYKGHHTICQFLRDIYELSDNEEIKLKCRIGMSMAKSMHERLKKYRKIMNAKEVELVEGDVTTYDEEK